MATVNSYTLKDGTERWMVRWYDADGIECKGRGFRLKRDALARKTKIENALLEGEPLPQARHRISVQKAMQTYLGSKAVADRPSTRSRDASVTKSLVIPTLGGHTLRSLTRETVQEWINELHQKDYAANTVRKAYQLLSGACEMAMDDGLLARNPCRKVRLPRVPKHQRPTVGVDELLRLAEAVPGQYRAMVVTAGLAGLRFGEVAGLRMSEIDLNARTITVVHQLDRKGDSARRRQTVPSPPSESPRR